MTNFHPPQRQKEWELAQSHDSADALHGGPAAGALERVGIPDAEDAVALERKYGVTVTSASIKDMVFISLGTLIGSPAKTPLSDQRSGVPNPSSSTVACFTRSTISSNFGGSPVSVGGTPLHCGTTSRKLRRRPLFTA